MDKRIPDHEDEEPCSDFERLLQRQFVMSGETTPAIKLVDAYRQKLDALADLISKKPQTAQVEPRTLFAAAKELDNLQCHFRLEYNLTALSFERTAMANAIDDTVTLLETSDDDFPYKGEIVSNSRDRSRIIRTGKEPDFSS